MCRKIEGRAAQRQRIQSRDATPAANRSRHHAEPIRPGIDLFVNGEPFRHTSDSALPLLWCLRDVLRLTGCKYGCDNATRGAYSVPMDGKLARACELRMQNLKGRRVTTVEGLAKPDARCTPLQHAMD